MTSARFIALLALPALLGAQETLSISNDKLSVGIFSTGASIVSMVRQDDAAKLNPLWAPGPQAGRGHFLCLDAFGPVSKEEQAAGLRFHGEAVTQRFQVVSSAASSITMRANLPLLQENVTRTYKLDAGESVLWVDTEVESLVGFDRPMVWAEHATVGWPFLAPGKTVVDISAQKAQTRPYIERPGAPPHRLPRGIDFTWPMAPAISGGTIDMRLAPERFNSTDHTTQLVDTNLTLGWATAINTEKRLIVGWVFRRDDFPWLQNWERYDAEEKRSARGLEFSTQPYDVPRRETVDMGRMFGVPTFRWLPAKSTVKTTFLVFFVPLPGGFTKVDQLRFEKAGIVIEDRKAGSTVTIPVARRF